MAYVSRIGRSLERSKIRKMNELCEKYDNVISFAIGEPDFPTPRHIVDEAIKALNEGKTKYAPNAGIKELRQEIAKTVKRTHGLDYDWETETIITACGMDTLRIASLALLEADDEMLIPDPTWANHPNHPFMASGRPVRVPVYEKDGFMYDVDELEKHITGKTKVLLLNSPSNPTGGVCTEKQMAEICSFCIDHDLFVVSDEVYQHIIYDGLRFCSPAMMPKMKERTLICNSFSKTYAMTGWRLGYAVGPADVIRAVELINENSLASVNTFVQYAGIRALADPQDCVREMCARFQARRDMVYSGINQIDGLSCIKPKGAFYAFVNIKETGLSSEDFARRLIEEPQVCVVPGNGFGEAGEGFVRLSYATSEANIQEGLRRIAAFMENLHTQS